MSLYTNFILQQSKYIRLSLYSTLKNQRVSPRVTKNMKLKLPFFLLTYFKNHFIYCSLLPYSESNRKQYLQVSDDITDIP